MRDLCCICGKELPNRWAVAGRCKAKGCDMPFCALHWRNGNRRCREHGWRAEGGGQRTEDRGRKTEDGKSGLLKGLLQSIKDKIGNRKSTIVNGLTGGVDMNEEKEQDMDLSKVPKKQGKKAMSEALKAAKAAGAGVAALVAKMKYARSPQAMQDTINENLEKNRERRDEVSGRLEEVHNRIVALKKKYEAAPAARKRTLQMELKGLMGEYKTLEREFKILVENEQVLGTVKGRFMETLAYDLRGVSEKHIDKIADGIEERVDDAEDVLDAVDDLEKAGSRRERETGEVDFDAELAAFGDEEVGSADGLADIPIDDAQDGQPLEDKKKKDPSPGLAEPEE